MTGMARDEAAVNVVGLRKVYHTRKKQVEALRGIDLAVRQGELLVLLGPSGCGKSTMLRCLAGLERPTHGTITFNRRRVTDSERGIHVPANKRDIGLVFQTYVLWPHMTVRKNVEYPLRARGRRTDLANDRAMEVLRLVRCDHLADRYPSEISGGQQQRVALARALASKPEVLLLDEPLSNLDALLRLELRTQLHEIHREVGYTGIYVTHDQAEALSLGDRVAVMQDGRVAQVGTPQELFERPRTEYVANFLGLRNCVKVYFDGQRFVAPAGFDLTPSWDEPPAPLAAGEYSAYFRPESVRLLPDNAPNAFAGGLTARGTTRDVLYGGLSTDCIVAINDTEIFARCTERVSAGVSVVVRVPGSDVLLYDISGNICAITRSPGSRREPDAFEVTDAAI